MTPPAMPEKKILNVTGILLIILGFLSMLAPVVAGTTIVIFIGAILLFAGIAQILQGLQEKKAGHWFTFVLGIIAAISGILIISQPLLGLTFLTVLMIAYFIADGVWKIFTAFQIKPLSSWTWLLLSGILSLLLGLLIWSDWPLSGLFAVGILVGVNLLVTGVMMMMVASNLRQLPKV